MERQNDEMACALQAMCGGSVEAFELFYSRYAPFVLQLAKRIMDDKMEAEDLCHDVFLEVLRKGERYDKSRGSIEAWLAVMTRSRGMDRLRRKQRVIVDRISGQEEELALGQTAGMEERVLSRLQAEAVSEAMRSLPSGQRKALYSSFAAYKSHREISESFNVPVGTVKSWIRYGVNNIRKQMARMGWLDDPRGGMANERLDS